MALRIVVTVMAVLAGALGCAGCDPWVIGHLRNETGDTIAIVRGGSGGSWCWAPQAAELDTYRLAPERWVRISVGTGRGLDDVIDNLECDTIMLSIGGHRRALAREQFDELDVLKVGSTYQFLVR